MYITITKSIFAFSINKVLENKIGMGDFMHYHTNVIGKKNTTIKYIVFS